MEKNKDEAIKKYLNSQKKEELKVVDGYDTDENIITDPSALKTIKNILNHKQEVKEKMLFLAKEIIKHAEQHDDSKLREPELNWLIEMDKENEKIKYGTPEYFEKQKRWEKFFKHHYKKNRHHPDHFENMGVYGMTIVDLVEMMCDIVSYCKELHVSEVVKIIDEQKKRFGIDDNISQILINTLNYYYAWVGDFKPIIEELKELEKLSSTSSND